MRAILYLLLPTLATTQTFNPKILDQLEWRGIGPASIGGRISGIEGVPGNPRLLYAATGSGGLFKTTNAGVTWQPIFERPETISIGDIAIDPKHPDAVWIGTGEANLRNSVSFGAGVYYSPDGGKTWEHRGLDETMTVSRIMLDPRDPRRVFVAAVGHPFGPNPERGVFFSGDSGRTWQKVLYTDDHHGASDLDIDPANPDVLFASMWQFDRKPWRYDSGSTGGGLYKSADGGKTWKKITRGLPELMGRIGVKVAPSNPRVVYVIAETRAGTLFRSQDGGESFEAVSSDKALVGRGYYYCDLRVDPKDENRVYVLENALQVSKDGGKTFTRIGGSVHGDLQALWIDPLDPARMWQGSDGGLAFTWDAGATWQHITSFSAGQFYHVYADNRKPFYQVSGGTQDNGTWTGPSRTREPSGILNDDWRMVSPIVGFNVLSDADDPDLVLTQTPGGRLLRTNLRTREQQSVSPQVRNYNGATAAEMKYRFAWDAPLVRSPHGRNTFYYAANVIFQSSDKGQTWEPISGDLTKADRSRMAPSGGPVFTDNSSSEIYGAITQISESPLKRGVIWTGTDDGNLQVTLNGGGRWTNVAANVPGIGPSSRVSALEVSHHDEQTVYAAFDRHMLDDLQPYLFKTADSGKTWRKITTGLPENAFIWVVREDPKNASIIYLGTEIGLFASFDAGEHWARFGLKNLPNVAIRDIFVQREQNDLLLATHGRGLWILDDATPIQELPAAASQAAVLFPIRPPLRHTVRATRAGGGDSEFTAPNPPYGAILSYYLREAVADLRFEILDATGKVIRVISGPRDPGVHRVAWDLRAGQRNRGPQVLPGVYTLRMKAGSVASEQKVEVVLDPELHVSIEDLTAQWDALARISALMERAGEKPQLRSLFNLVDAANAAPTSAMMKLLAELEAEARQQ